MIVYKITNNMGLSWAKRRQTISTVNKMTELKSDNLSMTNLYRKKPVIIEAHQYTGNNGSMLRIWSNDAVIESPVSEPTENNPTGDYIQIKTLEGVMIGIVGDFVIKGIKGEFYPCKPDVFAATYVKVTK